MKNIYFISDAHLSLKEDEIEKEKRKKLLGFLEYIMTAGEAKELYLLGDLFDFWFEWYHVIPKYWFPILYQLRKLVESGINVNFLTGNHDFYTGSYLQKEIGLRCFNESCEFEKDKKRFFVAHGDGYAKKDRGYRLLKKIIRSPVSIFLYKTFISPDLGMQMARWASKSSRQLVNIDKAAWAEEYYRFAQKKFHHGFDYVILGHLHYPIIKEDRPSGKTFVCCGDWMTQFTYTKYDGKRLTLEYWR
ncbi:MAG: UDP-2,3-diacylglucosamine diphosphatase [Candidatus Aminicenantes bacterium]|nr:MAG: UDP-2,3-diacylglucosamine diphosphatase [Candidatus Aminicenantes bacterium]